MIKPQVMDQLKNRFDNIYVLYDNDYTKENNPGRLFGNKISSKYQLKQIEIPDRFKSKDYSDLVFNHGTDVSVKLLKEMIA